MDRYDQKLSDELNQFPNETDVSVDLEHRVLTQLRNKSMSTHASEGKRKNLMKLVPYLAMAACLAILIPLGYSQFHSHSAKSSSPTGASKKVTKTKMKSSSQAKSKQTKTSKKSNPYWFTEYNQTISKPEYANVNGFISDMANYYNNKVNKKAFYSSKLQRQMHMANVVMAYVNYYLPKVKNQNKKQKLTEAKKAALHFCLKAPKKKSDSADLQKLKTIFNQLDH